MVSRRSNRTLTAIVGAAAALAIAVAVYGRGCESEQDTASAIARRFLAASLAGDASTMYELMSTETRKELTEAARRASKQVGGAKRYGPEDMISVTPSAAGTPIPNLTVESRTKDQVVFDVAGTAGSPAGTLRVISEDDGWRVHVSDFSAAGN